MIRQAQPADLEAILEIYNDAILKTTAVYDYKPHTIADRLAWYQKKVSDGFPVLVFEENNLVIGWATFGPFRPWPAYKYTIEHSVYVHEDHRRKQVATKLLEQLIKIAGDREFATMVAGIDSANEASVAIHRKLGFTSCGTIKKAGYKFGRWLDLTFYQYRLRGPARPEEVL